MTGLKRHADVFKWQGHWCVEIRIEHPGWTEVQKGVFEVHADALAWAARMVGA